MHYVIMHVQKQAAVPASNMVGKEAHTLLQAFKESASQELILLVNGKTAFTLMCVLVEAVVCARVCPYVQERAFSYRINCTSMHLEAS